MPPKKKKSGGKKSGKQKEEKEEQEADSGVPDELDKAKVIGDIKDWERRLLRYQEKHRQLEELHSHLMSGYEDTSKARLDTVAILKKKLEQLDDEIAELHDRLTGQRQLKEQQKEECEQRLQRLRTDFQEMKDQLTSENNLAATKLASLEEFKRDREAIEARYRALTEDFQKLLDDHEAAKERINQKNLLDRDRLKKDMVTRVNHVAADFRKVSNKQMAETTKRTIRENVSIQSQLLKMSEKQVELAEENAELRKRLRHLRRQIFELERSQRDTATKHACHQRILEMLRHKRHELQLLVDEYRRREKRLQELEEESGTIREKVEEQREEIELLAQQLEQQEEAQQAADEELQSASTDNDRCRDSIREASSILQAALQLPAGQADGERLLSRLRLLLTEAVAELPPASAAASRPLTAATQHTEEDVPLDDELLAAGGSGGVAEKSGSSLPDIGVASHCKPGALQLVPPPRQRIPTFKDKVAASTASRGDAVANLPPRAMQAFLLNQQQHQHQQHQQQEEAAKLPSSTPTRRTAASGASGSLFQLL